MASDDSVSRWHFAAAAAAWLMPGLGHYLLGHRARGLILAVGIGSLWLSGLLIGGISVLERGKIGQNFVGVGQVALAPSWVAYWVNARLQASALGVSPTDLERQPFEPSWGHSNEVGVLFTSLAGFLNLLAMIDVVYRDPQDPRYRAGLRPDEDAGEGSGEGSDPAEAA